MAQHDFVPSWLNFSTPQSAKAPGATFEKHGEHLPRGEGRFGVSRRRHNSSDGFFNNGPLRTAGDCWHQPSLHRHDSVDSGVSKGTHVGLAGSQPGWHGSSRGHDGMSQRGGGTGSHRHWNGNFHSRKSSAFQEKPPAEAREEKEEKEKLQFEEEDFPSLNPEAGKQNSQGKPAGTPSGVWGSPQLKTTCLATVQSYSGTEKSDLQPDLALTSVAASLQSRDQNSDAWQPAYIYDSWSIPGSRDRHLQPSQGASKKQSQWGKLDSFNNRVTRLTTTAKKVVKSGTTHLTTASLSDGRSGPSGSQNPPSAKQPTKMLVIKKVSKEDPAAAFSAAFTSPGPQLSNGNKATPIVPSVYKNLVPKPAAPPSKPNQWKANRSEHKPSSLTSSRDSAFTSPVSVTKPAVLASGSVLTSSKESPSSTTPPIEINSSRLTKLMRRTTDKKSEFLKALKDDRNGELPERHENNKLEDVDGGSTAEPKENWEENCHQNGLSLPLEEGENLSHSLEAEHRLLKAMGWQEYPENDENCLPLTEDELKEFQIKSEQLRRNGFRKSEFLRGQGSSQLFSHWRSTFKTEFEESDTETSSSETSDDDA